MKKILLSIIIILGTLTSFAQKDWKFSNSTPQELVKSHFYFLEKGHENKNLATFTMEKTNLSVKEKERRIIKLKEILISLNIDIDNIWNRRKGIKKTDIYYIFPKEKKIYLTRQKRKWYYSVETINNVPLLYNKYVLKFKPKDKDVLKNLQKEVAIEINSSKNVTLNRSTPYNTILSHIIYTDDSLFDLKIASKCINISPKDTLQAEKIAIKLKQIYLGLSQEVFNFKTLSRDSFYIDTITNLHQYWPNPAFKELYLEKVGDNWLYSRNSAELISSVHNNMYSEDAEQIFMFSDNFKKFASYFGISQIGKLQLWQIFMLLFFISILLIIYVVNKYLVKRVINTIVKNNRWRNNIFVLFNSIAYIIAINIISDYGPSFAFPIEYQHYFLLVIKLSKIFIGTLISVYIVNLLVIILTKEDSFDNRFGLVFFLGLLAKVIIFTASLLFTIDALGYNLINFLAGLSIGGFALALGAQDTIKNFFGSLMIFADDSFNVGDWIETNDVSGTVEKVGLRSTRVRTFHNSLVTIPNSNLSDNNIDNMGKRKYRRYSGKILLDYNTPTDKIELFIEKTKEYISKTDKTRKDFYMVYINNLDKYGIQILIYVFFKVDDWDHEMAEKHDLLIKILDIKSELGILFVKMPILEIEE
ncbi:MAG: mechanosensitive ion channel family protein [Bacteroidales bacterium]|nr:mechanosensitive ion channel family protein [Bacteroidales bacterium]